MTSVFNKKKYYQGNVIQQLKGFCATVELGSLSKAAKVLHTSHSAISLQIKALEQDLNVQLLKRNGPKIEITEAGKNVYRFGVPHLNALNNLKEHVQLNQLQPKTIRVGVNQSVLHHLLPTLLSDFYAKNENVDVEIFADEQPNLVTKLLESELDLLILPRRLHYPLPFQCEFIQVISFPVSLISRKDHVLAGKKRLTLEEISKYELILPPKKFLVIPNLYEKFEDLNLKCKVRTKFENSETTRKFVELGLGLNISSEIVFEKNHPILCATSLSHIFPDVDYGIVRRRNRCVNFSADAFVECVQKQNKD